MTGCSIRTIYGYCIGCKGKLVGGISKHDHGSAVAPAQAKLKEEDPEAIRAEEERIEKLKVELFGGD